MSADVAYLAGFFDGEGHIRITKHSSRGSFMLNISAVQATPYPLHLFVEKFGGTLKKRIIDYRGSPKALFTWQTSSACAENALREMLPYLVAKKDEADVALNFRSTFRPKYGERSKNSPELESSRLEMKLLLERMRHEKREAHIGS